MICTHINVWESLLCTVLDAFRRPSLFPLTHWNITPSTTLVLGKLCRSQIKIELTTLSSHHWMHSNLREFAPSCSDRLTSFTPTRHRMDHSNEINYFEKFSGHSLKSSHYIDQVQKELESSSYLKFIYFSFHAIRVTSSGKPSEPFRVTSKNGVRNC